MTGHIPHFRVIWGPERCDEHGVVIADVLGTAPVGPYCTG